MSHAKLIFVSDVWVQDHFFLIVLLAWATCVNATNIHLFSRKEVRSPGWSHNCYIEPVVKTPEKQALSCDGSQDHWDVHTARGITSSSPGALTRFQCNLRLPVWTPAQVSARTCLQWVSFSVLINFHDIASCKFCLCIEKCALCLVWMHRYTVFTFPFFPSPFTGYCSLRSCLSETSHIYVSVLMQCERLQSYESKVPGSRHVLWCWQPSDNLYVASLKQRETTGSNRVCTTVY